MAYEHDMPAAAHRHLDAGTKLEKNGRRDVAGYLFGLAAECAVKAMAARIPAARCDEIFYAHFPELRTLVRDKAQGHGAPSFGTKRKVMGRSPCGACSSTTAS